MNNKKCDHTYGFYVRYRSSYAQYYNMDFDPIGHEDGLEYGGTVAYCAECDKRLGKVDYEKKRIVRD